ncbi:hypothetical protein GF314_03045 [bacterium]|nr:hypothetical protein [bacterium]
MIASRPLPLRSLTVLAIVLVATGTPVLAGPHHAVSLQVLHPFGTSPDPTTSTDVRLSLLWGRSQSVGLFDLGLVATQTDGDVRGVQWVGAYAGIDGDLRGVGITSGLHRVSGDVGGAQFGGVASWTWGRVGGLQYGTLLSYAEDGVSGAQLSGLINICDGPGRWAQLSTVANVIASEFTGLQASTLFNSSGGTMQGAQFGLLNFARRADGVQIGLVNVAERARGVQIGLINATREMHGLPLGLVNASDDGVRGPVLYATSVSLVNVGYRSEVNGWYSTIAAGWYEVGADQTSAGSVAWHFGRRIWGDRHRSLAIDVGAVHLIPENAGERPDERLHPSVQIRLTGDLWLNGHWGLHGAVGLAATAGSYDDGADSEDELLLAAGVMWR